MTSRILRVLTPFRLPIFTMLVAIVATTSVYANDESADALLQKAANAMSPPISFHCTPGGIERVSYYKLLPNDAINARVEIGLKLMDKIRIVSGTHSYEYYPSQGTAIDTTDLLPTAPGYVKRDAYYVRSLIMRRQPGSARVIGVKKHAEAECFEIEFIPTQQAGEDLPDKQSSSTIRDSQRNRIAERYRISVAKDTYLVHEVAELSQGGRELSRRVYTDIVANAELPDDLFVVPDGVETVAPASMDEYTQLKGALYMSRADSLSLKPSAPSVPELLGPPMLLPVPNIFPRDPVTNQRIWPRATSSDRYRNAAPRD